VEKNRTLDGLKKAGIVAVLRSPHTDRLKIACEVLVASGIDAIEITLTVPKALDLIESLADQYGNDILLGVGSVLNAEQAQTAILAGAKFVVSPVVRTDVIEVANQQEVLAVPGAMTPTEVLNAWEAGGDLVKVFPCDSLGAKQLRALRGPLPHIPLMPTGGVDLENATQFLDAGAVTLGVGGSLVSAQAIENEDYEKIASRAVAFVNTLAQWRQDRELTG